MELMLDDLLAKRDVYEHANMDQCVITLETSIELAELLLQKERQQIIDAHSMGIYEGILSDVELNTREENAIVYYERTYDKD